MIVHVLLEENDEGSSFCHGVYANLEDAKKAKYTMISDQYHIPEDEVSNKDLDDEIYPSGVYYTIVQREVK